MIQLNLRFFYTGSVFFKRSTNGTYYLKAKFMVNQYIYCILNMYFLLELIPVNINIIHF